MNRAIPISKPTEKRTDALHRTGDSNPGFPTKRKKQSAMTSVTALCSVSSAFTPHIRPSAGNVRHPLPLFVWFESGRICEHFFVGKCMYCASRNSDCFMAGPVHRAATASASAR